jgi:multiple sugar transport system ATP-binding protein
MVIELPRDYDMQAGDVVRMSIDAAHLHLFDETGKAHHGD